MQQGSVGKGTKPDNSSLTPGTYVVEGENQLLEVVSGLHIHAVACPHHTHPPLMSKNKQKTIKTLFRERVSLCSPSWPGTLSVDQVGFELNRDLPAFAS